MSEVSASPNPAREPGRAPGGGTPPDSVEALLPAFALGAADTGEIALVKRELGMNCTAAEELTVYSMLADRLLYASAPVTPPQALAERVRSALTAPATTATIAASAAPGVPTQPVSGMVTAQKSVRRWLLPAAAAAAALVILVGLSLYRLREITTLRTDQATLSEQVATQMARLAQQDAQLAAQQYQLAEQDALLAALVSSEGERYTMNPAQEGSQALAEVAWLLDENVAVLRASGFPALEQGKVYQLWLIRDGERTSGGTFVVDAHGTGTFVFTPPESLDNFEGMGITPEPEGGSPDPTAPPVVRAEL